MLLVFYLAVELVGFDLFLFEDRVAPGLEMSEAFVQLSRPATIEPDRRV
jgi:hypothetical protein